jgi:hypothetical protein
MIFFNINNIFLIYNYYINNINYNKNNNIKLVWPKFL